MHSFLYFIDYSILNVSFWYALYWIFIVFWVLGVSSFSDVKERQRDRQTCSQKGVETDIQTDQQTYQALYFFISFFFLLQSMKPFYFVYLTFRRVGCVFFVDFCYSFFCSLTPYGEVKKANKVQLFNIKFIVILKLILNSLPYCICFKVVTKYCLIQTVVAFIKTIKELQKPTPPWLLLKCLFLLLFKKDF